MIIGPFVVRKFRIDGEAKATEFRHILRDRSSYIIIAFSLDFVDEMRISGNSALRTNDARAVHEKKGDASVINRINFTRGSQIRRTLTLR